MDKLYVIKIGGNIIDDEERLKSFLQGFARIEGKKILVHGGGKLATRMAEKLGIPQQMINGRRVTDAETLKLVTMVYGGYINKNIVAVLQSMKVNAIGLTGADGNLVLAKKREASQVDYGFAGDVQRVDAAFTRLLLASGFSPVIAPVTHNGEGLLLNTNADTIAAAIATAMAAEYDTTLVYCFEKKGVLADVTDESSLIAAINRAEYTALKQKEAIVSGMIPKLDNAFEALKQGVVKVIIGQSEDLDSLIAGTSGTTISNE